MAPLPAKPVPDAQKVMAERLSKNVHMARHEASPRPPCSAEKTTPSSCHPLVRPKATVVYAADMSTAMHHMRVPYGTW